MSVCPSLTIQNAKIFTVQSANTLISIRYVPAIRKDWKIRARWEFLSSISYWWKNVTIDVTIASIYFLFYFLLWSLPSVVLSTKERSRALVTFELTSLICLFYKFFICRYKSFWPLISFVWGKRSVLERLTRCAGPDRNGPARFSVLALTSTPSTSLDGDDGERRRTLHSVAVTFSAIPETD